MAPVPGPWWLQSDLSDGSPGAEKWSHSRPKDRKAGSGVTEVSGLSLVMDKGGDHCHNSHFGVTDRWYSVHDRHGPSFKCLSH